jgi:phosphoglycolate phosphatase
MNKVKLVGFDVNGTLFDDATLFVRAINSIFPKFGKPELPEDVLRQRFGQPWTKIYRDAGITEAMASEAQLYELYNELYQAGPAPKPFPGLKKALEWFSRRQIDLFIVSTQENCITNSLLEKYGLADFFVCIEGGVSNKSAAIREACDVIGALRTEVAYVGDQEGDIKHAKAAGCVSIAFAAKGGLHSEERLYKARPDFLIRKYAELKKLAIF